MNPSRRLFCLCVGTYDFTYMGRHSDELESFSTHSLQTGSVLNESKVNSSGFLPNYSMVMQRGAEDEIGVSQRVYCLMSYYPFFSFFADILLSVLNIIKIERLEIYRHKIEDIKQIDSKFQISRIKKIYKHHLKELNTHLVRLNSAYHLNLLNESSLLSTDAKTITYSESEEWDFQVMSLFSLDTFMDVLTLFLLEDKLFFVCDQSRILTYTVYLVGNLLPRPFKSAFPPVCIIPKEEEFLNVIFPCAYGLLKKSKWLDDNYILQRFKNTYIFISPAGTSITYTENRQDLLRKRPEKLKAELSSYFKEMEKRRKLRRKQLKYEN